VSYLKKIDVLGFKSFPKRTEIFFKDNVNVIIGPNGTGKSNILDAIIWGMGETKLSSLRGTSKEDIIFSGNTEKRPLASAEVSLVFNVDENGNEKRIQRKTYRDGSSIFRVNSKRVRLKDIKEELYKIGIGDNRYFSIKQGMISRIITMGEMEKRALLEEAAGISRYRDKKKESYHKLIEAENNLSILNNIIEEVQKELDFWKKEYEKYKEYKILKTEYRDIKKQLYFLQFIELEKKRDKYNRSIKNRFKILETKRLIKKEKENKLIKLNSLFWGKQDEIESKKDVYYSEREKFEIKKNELKTNKDKIKETEETLNKNKKNIEKSKEIIKSKASQKKDIDSELTKLKNKRNVLNQEKEKIQRKTSELKDELAFIEDDFKELQEDFISLTAKKTKLHNNIVSLGKFIKSSSFKLEKIDKNIENSKIELKNIEQNQKKIKDQQLKDYTDNINSIEQKIKSINKNIESLEKNIREKELDKQNYLTLFNEYKDRLDKLLSKRNLGIGKNISIKKNLPQPIALLLEPLLDLKPLKSLQELEDEENFFILEQEKKVNLYDEYIETPFLNYFPPFKLTDNIKVAVESWKKQRANYVTKDGYLITYNGEILKGKKEGMLFLKEKIKEYENVLFEKDKILENLKLEYNNTQNKYKNNERKLENLKKKQKTEDNLKQKNENKLRILQTQKENINRNLNISTKERENYKNEIDKYKDEKNHKEVIYQKTIEEEKKLIENKIFKEEQLDEIKSQINEAEENLNNKNNKLYEVDKSISTREKEIISIEERIQIEEERIKDNNKENLHLQENKNKLNQASKNLNEFIKKKESELKNKKEELDRLFHEESELKNRIDELEKDLKKTDREVSSYSNDNNKEEIKKAELERDIINLEDIIWKELTLNPEELKKTEVKTDFSSLQKQEHSLNEQISCLSDVRFEAESEYNKFKDKYDFYTEQKEDIENSIKSTKQIIQKIDKESKKRFLKTLDIINKNFNQIFNLLFGGGSAKVHLIDESDVLNSGVSIKAKLPGKRLQNLQLLSGGEKALSSLAFLFSMFKYKPSPICLLDEVDAPLDEANIQRLLNLIKKLNKESQFIIVTHNPKTLEVGDSVYGITMKQPGISDIYSIKIPEKMRKE